MSTAKVFMTGRSQAVRLPKEFRFDGSEVEIFGVVMKLFYAKKVRRLLNYSIY